MRFKDLVYIQTFALAWSHISLAFGPGFPANPPDDFSTVGAMVSNIRKAHGKVRNEEKYFSDMDASMKVKVDLILPEINKYILEHSYLNNFVICDVGTGTGKLAAHLADILPAAKVIGTDIMESYVDLARKTHSLDSSGKLRSNLEFRHRDSSQSCVHLKLDSVGRSRGADIVIFSSVLHEIYSYGGLGDDLASLRQAIEVAYSSLAPGGQVIIRDFIAPPADMRDDIIFLKHRVDDIRQVDLKGLNGEREKVEMTCSRFADDFTKVRNKGKTTRSDIFCREIKPCNLNYKCYETNWSTAFEFMFRKNYEESYSAELNERYGFANEAQIRSLLQESGFTVKKLETSLNPWVKENRLEKKIKLYNPKTGEKLKYPEYQMLVVGEKWN